MKGSSHGNFRKNLAAASLIAAPLLLLAGDAAAAASPETHFVRYFLCKLGFAFFVFAFFVLVDLLKPYADRLGLIAGGMAIIGAISGATLFSFVYFYAEARAVGAFDPASAANSLFERVYSTMVMVPLPGLFFPVGLTILSIGLFWKKVVPRPAAALLAAGAILFPIGRIPGILSISIVSDIFLAASMCFIGWRLATRSEFGQSGDEFVIDEPIRAS